MPWARHAAHDHGVQLWRLNYSSSYTVKLNHTLQPAWPSCVTLQMQACRVLQNWGKSCDSCQSKWRGWGVWESKRPIAKKFNMVTKLSSVHPCTVVAASVCWHLSQSVVHTTWMQAGWDHDSLWTSTRMVLPSSAPAHNFNCCSSLPEVFLSMLRKRNLRNDWTCRKCARKICTRKDLSWALLPSSHHPPTH
jgi:hypothetical protein